MTSRLEALAHRLDAPLLVTDLVNIRYLTGFDSSNAALLVQPAGEAALFTDFRYIEAARAVEGVEATLAKRSLLRDITELLPRAVQFEAAVLPYAQWQVLDSMRLSLTPTRGIVEELRVVKDAEEQRALRRAARTADRAFEALTAETFVGRTERELAWRLKELMHAHGAEDVSFEPIVAAGANGARPHAAPEDRLVETRTLVVVDFGVRMDGYCSDCTRTLSTGGLPDRLRRAYDVCLAAQQAAVAGIRPTMTGVEADRLARSLIDSEGFGDAFGHGLGHGVGLQVHEAPRLSTESDDTLQTGNAVTIEPGIYLAGLGGVRIEDLAIVTDEGVEVLTSFPKSLVEVG
jgi:Xaa-Pro aminopeptidase